MSKKCKLEYIKRRLADEITKYFNSEHIPMVFGEGNLDAQLILVGEAPGSQEIRQGRPFVGQAGKNLQHFLNYLGIQRQQIYITNVVKFRPYKVNKSTGRKVNRKPSRSEIRMCSRYLLEEISTINPSLIVSLGNVPLQALTGNQSISIGQVHGNIMHIKIDDVEYNLFPLYHPASVIYRRALIDIYNHDLDKLKTWI